MSLESEPLSLWASRRSALDTETSADDPPKRPSLEGATRLTYGNVYPFIYGFGRPLSITSYAPYTSVNSVSTTSSTSTPTLPPSSSVSTPTIPSSSSVSTPSNSSTTFTSPYFTPPALAKNVSSPTRTGKQPPPPPPPASAAATVAANRPATGDNNSSGATPESPTADTENTSRDSVSSVNNDESPKKCTIQGITEGIIPFLKQVKQARDSYVEAVCIRKALESPSRDMFQTLQQLFPTKQHKWHEWTRLLAREGIETLKDLTDLCEREFEETATKWPVVLASNLRRVRKGADNENYGGYVDAKELEKQPGGKGILQHPTSFKEGQYVNEKVLGSGQFGSAYLVKGPAGLVVLKLITTSTLAERNQAWKEARAMACIPKSEHLVQVLDFFEEEIGICIVMTYCPGGTVQDLVGKRPEVSEISRILLEIASGLKVLHDNAMVHRDVKPDNLFIAEDRKVRIGDFGLTRTSNDGGYIYAFGCRPYMAPELRMTQMSPASDMWALGCVAISLLTGVSLEARFQENNSWVLGGLSGDEINSFVDSATAPIRGHPLATIVKGLLHPDHHHRLSSQAAVLALTTVASTTSSSAVTTTAIVAAN